MAVLEAGSGRSAWQGPGESLYLTVGLIGTEGLWSSGIKETSRLTFGNKSTALGRDPTWRAGCWRQSPRSRAGKL